MSSRPDDLVSAEEPLLDGLCSLAGIANSARSAQPESIDSRLHANTSLTGRELSSLFDAQVASRNLDHAARWLRSLGEGFYTIGSAGHEANALVAAALRPTDPALLHYRSGGFYLARATQVPGHDGVDDVLRGLLASVDEPIAGGRHKVFGHHDLAVIPQTSTIASHLPRALGVAWAVGRSGEAGHECEWLDDSVVVCSFGDASLNHSTAQGALNAAAQFAYRGWKVPVLFDRPAANAPRRSSACCHGMGAGCCGRARRNNSGVARGRRHGRRGIPRERGRSGLGSPELLR